MKKIVYSLALILALVGCGGSQHSVMVVENGQVSKDSANITVDINYPIVTQSNFPKLMEAINLRMEQVVWDQTPRVYDPENEDLRSITYEPEIGYPVSSEMHWNIVTGDKISSVEMGGYWFCGGAHGMSFSWTELYDNKTGEPIHLRDYIKDSVAILDVVSEELKADSIMLGDWVGANLPLPNNFKIDSVSITAIYNQYDIAPYAAGILEIPIYFSQIPEAIDTVALAPSTLRTIYGK